jgi:hypothetical protein
MRTRKSVAISLLLLVLSGRAAFAQSVVKTTVDYTAHTITIQLSGFRSNPPAAWLAGTPLEVISYNSTTQVLVARLATIPAPGTYSLNLVAGGMKAAFDVTIGAMGPVGPVGPQGPQGPAGPTGAQGPLGPQGPQGDTGAMGPQGPTGPQGPKGDTGAAGNGFTFRGEFEPGGFYNVNDVVRYDGSTYVALVANSGLAAPETNAGTWSAFTAKGDAGPAGPEGQIGPVGPQGPLGPTGPAGPAGPVGATGPTGAQGPKGDQGATGPQGDTGAPGRGFTFRGPFTPGMVFNVDDVVLYSGSTYIALAPTTMAPDEDTLNWSVFTTKGDMGPAGPEGPMGPIGAQGPAGQIGPVGPQGWQGPQGAPGPAGPQGPAGVSGYYQNFIAFPLNETTSGQASDGSLQVWTAGRTNCPAGKVILGGSNGLRRTDGQRLSNAEWSTLIQWANYLVNPGGTGQYIVAVLNPNRIPLTAESTIVCANVSN